MRSALPFSILFLIVTIDISHCLPVAHGPDNVNSGMSPKPYVHALFNTENPLRSKFDYEPTHRRTKRLSSLTDDEKEQQRSDKRIQGDAERIENRLSEGIQDISDAGAPGNITTCDSNAAKANEDVDRACERINKKFQGGLERVKADALPANSTDSTSKPLSDDPSDPNISPFVDNRLGDDVIQSNVCVNTQPEACDALRAIAQNNTAF